MEFRQLEAFLAVAEHLHFGHAADSLFMAQAPLSRAISSLESELDTRLFTRSTRSVRLTEVGAALVAPAQEALEAVRRVAATVHAAASGEIGVVHVEFSGVAAHPIVATLARSMRSSHPGIRVELASQPISRPSMSHLVAGTTDIVLGRWDQFPPEVSAHVMTEDSLSVVLPRSHRLATAETVSFTDIARESFVSLPYAAGSITTDRLWRLGFACHTPIDNVQFAPDTQSCIALVSAEVGCHLALTSVGRWTTNPDVVFVPLAIDDASRIPDVHLRVAWRTDDVQPAAQIALDYLIEQSRDHLEADILTAPSEHPKIANTGTVACVQNNKNS
ncbi:LysR family transcriptional regulator [Rhodococcus fascians]|uniref:LysR family transcriptional regulator n=1 Tax=Rhodococcoides fascians TaxID=1828 RepID=UPI001C90FBA9|nr:LysR family transcriptional regulator [Rhodococcus fascians]MBY3792982.1 LysR family transcriptional regulator [Rhodococcus fascians]MBY3825739.1 LysR family transcriptional regulator [Rhodococcus fascians]MBY3836201.1 LysR family transcriptional regulator [Rhodococcus fascians]MBY3866391.1 LysR family transcriptional regulator [Rhodococcus fascians]MBY3884883.1 LysR family transcriptional regulator [Rhodococcus fascians]